MEFTGRILKVLPQRSGKSERTGNEWHALPFIFEYFENPSDRYSDKVLLETFDENIIPQIVENLPVRIGFGHHVREYTNQQGKTVQINEVRMYKFEPQSKQAPQPQNTGDQLKQTLHNDQVRVEQQGGQQQAGEGGKADDLPF